MSCVMVCPFSNAIEVENAAPIIPLNAIATENRLTEKFSMCFGATERINATTIEPTMTSAIAWKK